MDSVGQPRMSRAAPGRRDKLEVSPNLWAGVGLVRGGAGTALVGDPETVAARMHEYRRLGIDTFILSGYPHLEEAIASASWCCRSCRSNPRPDVRRRRCATPGVRRAECQRDPAGAAGAGGFVRSRAAGLASALTRTRRGCCQRSTRATGRSRAWRRWWRSSPTTWSSGGTCAGRGPHPHVDAAAWFKDDVPLVRETAFRNGSPQAA